MLRTHVDAWADTMTSVLDLAPTLGADDLSAPTDCPGWTVQDVLAHLAHLESVLAGIEADTRPDVDGGSTLASDYTEAGVLARRGRPASQVVDELRAAVEARTAALSDLPDDASAPAPLTPGGVSWTWDTLLRNRVIDAWTHEQDIRRAVGRSGGLDRAAAVVTLQSLAAAMPFVVGKKVGAPMGTTVRWQVTGPVELELGVTVGEDGRARRDDAVASATTTITLDSETFCVLAAGRRGAESVPVEIDGDVDLGRRVVAAMTVTF